jgi:hypothetical protein
VTATDVLSDWAGAGRGNKEGEGETGNALTTEAKALA